LRVVNGRLSRANVAPESGVFGRFLAMLVKISIERDLFF
jgi:hypothetical protein